MKDAVLQSGHAAGAPPPADERANILIVDDLPEKLLVFGTVLEELQQNLVFVRSGKDALREVLQREFAVILLDVNMPDLDGFETAELIRNYPKSAHTPIIFITSYADEMQTARGYQLGAVDYILSPVVPTVLRSKVRVFVSLYLMQRQIRAQADARTAMMAAEAARRVAEENDRRSAFLSHASRVLGESLDVEVGVRQLAELVVPQHARLAFVVLADDQLLQAEALMATATPLAQRATLRKTPLADVPRDVRTVLQHAVEGRTRVTLTAGASTAAAAPAAAAAGAGASGAADAAANDSAPPADAPTRALTAVPLMSGERVLGALLAVGDSELDWPLLEDLAGRAGTAFENARLFGSLGNEIVERRAAEAELQIANQRKDEFLAMLSHELRNPLAAIRAALEVTKRVVVAEPKVEWAAEIMDRQLRQMTRLVDELLDVARISQNKIVLGRERIDLNSVVAQSVETAQPFIAERQQRLDVTMSDEPIWLQGDAARLTQIVSNLLHNASKFSGRGTQIELRCGVDDQGAVISVRDHGIGIEPALLPRIFDLFAQGARGLDRQQGGLGVGLTLAMRLAQLHGGSIEASSEGADRGSEFRVRLPCLWLARGDAAPRTPETPAAGAPSRRVLVVDDNRDAARSIAALLELHGHVVRTANDGPEALQGAAEFAPDIVILDIGLPLLDGYEVARRLRAMTTSQPRPLLVALTGYGQREDRAAAFDAGFDHHFVKPADPAQLLDCIAQWQPARHAASRGGDAN